MLFAMLWVALFFCFKNKLKIFWDLLEVDVFVFAVAVLPLLNMGKIDMKFGILRYYSYIEVLMFYT